jgi:uncharacterized protein
MKVAIVGATGMIGRRLVDDLTERGDTVVAISRKGRSIGTAAAIAWDPALGDLPADALNGVEAIVNLAGAGIGDAKWSDARKALILHSRVAATRGIVTALDPANPRVLVNASAIGIYPPGEGQLDESSAPGTGFLPDVCTAWEREASAATAKGSRVVMLRIGVVMAAEGGALKKQLLPFKFGAGGPLGGGRQWVSWVHISDVIGAITLALDTPSISGPVNVTAPNPVRQKDFARALGKALGRPAFLPTPGFVLKAVMGEMATLALDGQYVAPKALQAAGYVFQHTDIGPALIAEVG